MPDRHRLTRLAAFMAIAATLANLVPAAPSQAVKRGDPARRLPKVGIIAVPPAEIFPVEVGQKIFTGSDATIESVAPEMVGLNAVRFTRGGSVWLGTTADVQLLIGYFRAEGPEWASPPLGQTPVIRNAAKIFGMPPVDIYLIPFKRNNYRQGTPLEIRGTFAMLGVIPIDMELIPFDARGGKSR